MGLFSRILGSRKWEELPIKFVDSVKSRLSEHNLKVLQSLTLKHNILNLEMFQNSQLLLSKPDLIIKSLSYALAGLGNKLARNGSFIEAENAFLLSVMLNPNNHENPSHFCLAILYVLTNRNKEAQKEGRLASEMFEHLLDRMEKIQKNYFDSKDDFMNFDTMTALIGLQRMLEDIFLYGNLSQETKKSDLFTRCEFVIQICVLGDTDIKQMSDKFI